MFRENELSIFGKTALTALVILAAFSALSNIYRGAVPSPGYFIIALVGFGFFLFAKALVISKGVSLSFGTRHMPNWTANLYRFGYWLMAVGIICTFAG